MSAAMKVGDMVRTKYGTEYGRIVKVEPRRVWVKWAWHHEPISYHRSILRVGLPR